VSTEKANEQHYEVPAALYALTLGPHRKYSSCFFARGDESLEQAEADMLALTCKRAAICDGDSILELGCGWGSLTLYMAKAFPSSSITALSNSHSQREYILEQARSRGLSNIEIITGDINEIVITKQFRRVVSVEMFEHMRNHAELLKRIRGWMNDDSTLFIHIFCHARFAYLYGTEGLSNWLGKNFFSGGMMPSDDLLLRYQEHVTLLTQWRVSGTHYGKTAEAWLSNLKTNRAEVLRVLAETYGEKEALRWWNRWAIFFLACAELFSFRNGREWYVSHYLFKAR
jgi:cyclopropane-fatty-acyl-phospholipid synthase